MRINNTIEMYTRFFLTLISLYWKKMNLEISRVSGQFYPVILGYGNFFKNIEP